MAAARYDLSEHSGDLAIAVRGPDEAACLAAAVRGLAAAVGEVTPQATRAHQPIVVTGSTPTRRLVALLQEAIAALDADGLLAVDLRDPRVAQHRLAGSLVVVALTDVEATGPPPKAVTWHEAHLAPDPEGHGWRGRVVVDL